MTRILISGCNGQMGCMIAEDVKNFPDMEVVAGVDQKEGVCDFSVYKSIENISFPVDAVIDFSHPSLLEPLLNYAKKYKVPAVIATTGYSETQIKMIKKAAEEIPVFYTANMSFGINLMCLLLKKAALLLYDNFDIEIIEKHHNRKLDAPSGTAKLLSETIKTAINDDITEEFDRHSKRERRKHNEIGIHSVRGGSIVGEHEVLFAGEDEFLSITHTASSRRVFAKGALKAAKFIAGKQKGLYTMDDLFK